MAKKHNQWTQIVSKVLALLAELFGSLKIKGKKNSNNYPPDDDIGYSTDGE